MFALTGAALGAGGFNTPTFRHAIERMDPGHYLTSSYYEHWLTAVATLLVEDGRRSRRRARRARGPVPAVAAGRRSAPTTSPRHRRRRRRASPSATACGSATSAPRGHTRCPGYVRGRRGRGRRASTARAPVPELEAHRRGAGRTSTTYARPLRGRPSCGATSAEPTCRARRPVRALPRADVRTSMSDDHHHPAAADRRRAPGAGARGAARREGPRRPRSSSTASSRRYAHDIGPMNGAKVVARAWVDPDYRRAAARRRHRRDRRARLRRARGRPHRRRREHARRAQRRRLHAVLVLPVAGARPAAELVQEPAVPGPHGARAADACSPRWAATCPTTSRSGCGTRAPRSATSCCRSDRPAPSGCDEDELAALVTRDAMIGVARL